MQDGENVRFSVRQRETMCSAEHTKCPRVNWEKTIEEKDMNRGWQENTGAEATFISWKM